MTITWINCSERMPPDDDSEIIIFNLETGQVDLTPANEIFYEVGLDNRHEWKWCPYTEEAWSELTK